MLDHYVRRILRSRIYDLVEETPVSALDQLSARIGRQVLLKREDLQPVFSFKLRGAYNKLLHLGDDERAAGVVAASAGNHAQGLAMAAAHLGVHARIVMPPDNARHQSACGEGAWCRGDFARGQL